MERRLRSDRIALAGVVAATALEAGLAIYAIDAHFEGIPSLRLHASS